MYVLLGILVVGGIGAAVVGALLWLPRIEGVYWVFGGLGLAVVAGVPLWIREVMRKGTRNGDEER